eukprot:653551-Amphidinium_carterae.1
MPFLALSLTTALVVLLPSVTAAAPAVSVVECCSAMASTMLKLRLSSLSKLLRLASSRSISTRSQASPGIPSSSSAHQGLIRCIPSSASLPSSHSWVSS